MPAQPPTIQDVPGSNILLDQVKHGSQIINFPSQGDLVAEELTFTKEMRGADFTNPLGQDDRAAYSTKKGTGSMVVQFRGKGAVIGVGELFTFEYQGGFNIGCIITSVGNVFTQNGAAKIPVTFSEYLSGSILPKTAIYDGSLGVAVATGPVLVKAYNIPGHPIQTFVARQRFAQLGTSWASTALGTAGPVIEGQPTYLVDETETEDVGTAGMITRDKVWAMKPFAWDMPVSVPKNYQEAKFVINGSGQNTDLSIAGYTQVVKAVQHHEYILDPAGSGFSLPKVPSISIIKYLTNSLEITDFGSGFPRDGNGRFTNNQAVSFITGGIEPYIGKMYCVKTVYG